MTASITLDMPNMLQNLICLKDFGIPLTNKAKKISVFVTPNGQYQYKVMPLGMKNSPPTFFNALLTA